MPYFEEDNYNLEVIYQQDDSLEETGQIVLETGLGYSAIFSTNIPEFE
jgi:hypothetical protein